MKNKDLDFRDSMTFWPLMVRWYSNYSVGLPTWNHSQHWYGFQLHCVVSCKQIPEPLHSPPHCGLVVMNSMPAYFKLSIRSNFLQLGHYTKALLQSF